MYGYCEKVNMCLNINRFFWMQMHMWWIWRYPIRKNSKLQLHRLVATEVEGWRLFRRGESDFASRWRKQLWSFFEGKKEKLVIESVLLFSPSSTLFLFIFFHHVESVDLLSNKWFLKQERVSQQKRGQIFQFFRKPTLGVKYFTVKSRL